MATKAERFRYEVERSGEKKPKQPAKRKGRGDGGGELAHHNLSERAAKKAAYAMELTDGARPSRKSTRKAANRQKTDVQFRLERKVSRVRPESHPPMP